MRFHEVAMGGVLMSPFVPMMATALALLIVLRRFAFGARGLRHVWHPALFQLSVYVILLALVVMAVSGWRAHG